MLLSKIKAPNIYFNMCNIRISRIALAGAFRGSALLTERDGKTETELFVRGLPDGAELYTVGNRGTIKTLASEKTVPQTDVCAVVLTSGGRVIASGFTGECRENRQRLLDEIRIRASEPEKNAPREEFAPKPEAAVTEGIIRQAGQLFKGRREDDEPEFRRIKNPFPRTFPRSYWRERRGDTRLYGELVTPKGIEALIAVPAREGRGLGPFMRGPVVASDGTKYYIGRDFIVENS